MITLYRMTLPQAQPPRSWHVWIQWVAANALAEMVGLGASLLLALIFLVNVEQQYGIVLAAVLVVVGSTLIEGIVVGLAQSWVLRQIFPHFVQRAWLIATGAGALIAWALGVIPSTVMSLNAEASAMPAPELDNALVYVLAAGMGLVLGPVLGTPQWWVLRRYVPQAGWWILANALAWAVGMPIIFIGMGFVPAGALTLTTVAVVLASLAAAGAAVGAVHGLALLWLVRNWPRPKQTE
jgi:hypothetical protein